MPDSTAPAVAPWARRAIVTTMCHVHSRDAVIGEKTTRPHPGGRDRVELVQRCYAMTFDSTPDDTLAARTAMMPKPTLLSTSAMT